MSVVGNSVAECAVAVVAPALDRAAEEERGAEAARADLAGGRYSRNLHGSRAEVFFEGVLTTAVIRYSVAELARAVVAPTLDRSAGDQGADGEGAGADRGCVGYAADGDRSRAAGERPVVELATTIVTPAVDRAAGEQGTRGAKTGLTSTASSIPTTFTGVGLKSLSLQSVDPLP